MKRMRITTKILAINSAIFIFISIALIFFVNHRMKGDAPKEAESKALVILNRNLSIHNYFSHDLKPKIFELSDLVKPKDYFEPVWMSSTFAIRKIDEYAKSLSAENYYYKECAINARSPENEADSYERTFINELNANPNLQKHSTVRTIDGKPYFAVMIRGEVMEQSCYRCHSTPEKAPAGLVQKYGKERSFNRNVGDVVSAISIRMPLSAAYSEANLRTLQLSGFLLLILLSLFVSQLYFLKKSIIVPFEQCGDQKEILQTILDNIPVMIAFRDSQENLKLVNKSWERTLGWSFKETQSRDILVELYPDPGYRQKAVDFVRKSDGKWEEFKTRRRDGIILDALWINIRLSDGSRIGMGLDITDRKQSEEALRKSQEELAKIQKLESIGYLAGGIAHDFNNILTAILGNISLAKMLIKDSDKALEKLSSAERACMRATELTQQFITFSKGGEPLRKPAIISELLKDTVIQALTDSNVKAAFLIQEDLSMVEIDEAQMKQAVKNIIINAKEAMPDGGIVEVSASNVSITPGSLLSVKPGEYVKVSIKDHGAGIPKEYLAKIFDPYFTTKRMGADKGLGLGLAIAHSIVKRHDGYILVDSTVGVGTIVDIYLPRHSS